MLSRVDMTHNFSCKNGIFKSASTSGGIYLPCCVLPLDSTGRLLSPGFSDYSFTSHMTQNRSFWRRSSSQSLGIVLKKLNLTQQKQTTQEQNTLSYNIKISPVWDWQSTPLEWLSSTRDRDSDLGSGHTAYRRASLIELYLQTEFHWNWKNFFLDELTAGTPKSRSRDTKTRKLSKIRPEQI